MSQFTIQGTGKTVNLNRNNFLARGGEGDVYIVGDTIYKITSSANMIPCGKIKELERLGANQYVIIPRDILLNKGQAHGYTMRAVPHNPMALAKILPKGYREREKVTPQTMMSLVKKMMDGINFIHSHDGFLQVDGNELNYMITSDYQDVYFIDVNSYQTPSYDADAIMPSIRDYSVPIKNGHYDWSILSDAWSFAIISFHMFTAMHPFKGRHPDHTNSKQLMVDNMVHHKSVLDPATQFPHGPVYYPFQDYIPGGSSGIFGQWYNALFVNKERYPIPKDFQGQLNLNFIPIVKHIQSSQKLNIQKLQQYDSTIRQYYVRFFDSAIVTENKIHTKYGVKDRENNRSVVGWSHKYSIPLEMWLDNDRLTIHNLENDKVKTYDILCKDIMAFDGRIYLRGMSNIYELGHVEIQQNRNTDIAPLPRVVVSIMPNATTMYDGVVIQDMFGTKMISIFPQMGCHKQFQIKELQNCQIIEAKYRNAVLMCLVFNTIEQVYQRLVFRFSSNWNNYDVRIVNDISLTSLNFIVTHKGICICVDENNRLEIFLNQYRHKSIQTIDDVNIQNGLTLYCTDSNVQFSRDDTMYSLSMS